MGRDRREDEGQYYPGGKTIPVTPQHGGGGGDMKHAEFAELNPDLNPEESTLDNVMAKVNRITELLRGGAAALAIICSLCAYGAVTVEKAKLSSLPGKTMIVTEVNYTAEDLNTNAVIALVAEYDQTNITPRIDAKVESVNGMTGTVVLVASDIGAALATNTYTKSQVDLEISGAVSPVNTIAVNANAIALRAEAKADAALFDLDGKLGKASGAGPSIDWDDNGNLELDGNTRLIINGTVFSHGAIYKDDLRTLLFNFSDGKSGNIAVDADFAATSPSPFVTNFVQSSSVLTARINALIEARIGDIERALKHILGGN